MNKIIISFTQLHTSEPVKKLCLPIYNPYKLCLPIYNPYKLCLPIYTVYKKVDLPKKKHVCRPECLFKCNKYTSDQLKSDQLKADIIHGCI